jgi:hypothetical protein
LLTSAGLIVGFQVSSSLGVIIIVSVFIFSFERTLKKSARSGRLGRVDKGNCSACR